MTSVRRHLASLGLAVALCHLIMQVLVPAALCCETLDSTKRLKPVDCCPAGSHAGRICPMHGGPRTTTQDAKNCHAEPLVDLHDLFVALNAGGIVPAFTAAGAPRGSEDAPSFVQQSLVDLPSVPPGPPPRA